MILKPFDKERTRLLISRGVPAQDLVPRKFKMDTEEVFVKMEPDIPRVMTRPISISKQERSFETLIEHPLRSNGVIGIGSFPTDMRAKHLAQFIMSAAIDNHLKHRRMSRSLPLWHRVYGGLTDPLRDKPIQDMPCMLIIANVDTSGTSSYKLEKVRDLLEKFSDIPRIVVSGGEAPCGLFANRLHYPCQYTLYAGPPNMERDV